MLKGSQRGPCASGTNPRSVGNHGAPATDHDLRGGGSRGSRRYARTRQHPMG